LAEDEIGWLAIGVWLIEAKHPIVPSIGQVHAPARVESHARRSAQRLRAEPTNVARGAPSFVGLVGFA
jgi:hypothetical protein